MINRTNELSEVSDEVFALVARELATGKPDEVLWTKAFALQNGNESAAKAHYIRLRAEQIQRNSGIEMEPRSELLANVPALGAGPWPRYFARYLDLTLGVCLSLFLLFLLLAAIKPADLNMLSPILVIFLLMAFLVPILPWVIDAVIVTIFGNSLGKAIWGITVRHKDGRQLTFKETLNRNFSVCLHGFWIGISPLTFLPHIFSYRKLKRDGITKWDDKGQYEVLSSNPGVFRKICGVILLVTASGLAGLTSMATDSFSRNAFGSSISAKNTPAPGGLDSQTPQSTLPNDEIAALTKRAEAGDADAQDQLGVKYVTGNGVPQDFNKAFKWFQKAALQGHAVAQHNLAYMYGTGKGTPLDDNQAFEWYQKSALQGFSGSQYEIGERYLLGNGVPQDFVNAFNWLQKAALQGDAQAQWRVGAMYRNGRGVAKDSSKAFEWYQKAAAQGNPQGRNSLGTMYYEANEMLKALELYQQAAIQGDAAAQSNLGSMYANGEGIPTNFTKAAEYYQKAAVQGYANAQYALAAMYANGDGVLKDYVLAYSWANLAAKNGIGDAPNLRTHVEQRMTPAEIAEGQRLSASWKIGQLLSR